MVFFFICLSNIFINVDHGIIPAATKQIKEDLKVGDAELGLLGSFVYFGIISAGFFAGVAQVFLLVYFPVWVDLLGGEIKTLWLTILQIGVPLGVFIGYAITASICDTLGWRFSFYIQCIFCGIPLIFFLFLKNEKMEINLSQFQKTETKNINQKHKESNQVIHSQNEQNSNEEQKQQKSITYPQQIEIIDNKQQENQINIYYYSLSFFQLFKKLWKSKLYIISMLTITLLYFVVTVSLTAPTLGVLFGGILTQKLGGYESFNAKKISLFLACISSLVACPVPFFDSFYLAASSIWCLLFFGGAMVPGLTGMMLSSVEAEFRGFANSNSQTFQSLLGYLPAPTLYGLLNSYVSNRAGMIMIIYKKK
ncbi:major facilitator superfamily protein, putative [Ichthyophthirius multifiliis]|uniref:Major facilitator superfamily protein, putative n=1 Tax=Ichthyophthirius multifiliis TaxID=5932 RepID=G0QSW8_ICHMU|nr:major facilitator superfamily protein, putative [Ichthyophthirius multifiliis]EGR31685.1 major facilitator superfamily protein, putative [Ichthyophthirius multifiliis]|eukprot:XP_004035171.1 major facilitator superfamily protein, putative [Ichthyophthirius multifiliis]